MFKPVVVAAIASAAVLSVPGTASAEPTSAIVTNVIDGHTVEILGDSGRTYTVRIAGIIAPVPNAPVIPNQCWGEQATQFARDNLLGRRVAVAFEPGQPQFDGSGRMNAQLTDGGDWWYSVEAVKAGAAKVFTVEVPVTIYPELVLEEGRAEAAHRGLWGSPCNGSLYIP